MSLDADQIVDRRRLRRKLAFWRVAGFVVLALALIAVLALTLGPAAFRQAGGPQIARISISGFITENRDQLKLIADLAKNDSVRAVIVAIDSGGGASAGGEALYEALRKLAAAKPTVSTMGTIGASAAYMAALGTDHIVARRTTITGSIGVIFQYPQLQELLRKLGVSLEEIKSRPLKAEPSPFHPPSPEAEAVIRSLIEDSYQWFVGIVAERRGLSRPAALALADGRVFSGQQALEAKLIDAVGGEETALTWLKTRGIDTDLPVRDWTPRRSGGLFSLSDAALLWIARQLGLGPAASAAVEDLLPERLKLDGLLSVWQAPLSEINAEGAAR